jgi:hypothetical protein
MLVYLRVTPGIAAKVNVNSGTVPLPKRISSRHQPRRQQRNVRMDAQGSANEREGIR